MASRRGSRIAAAQAHAREAARKKARGASPAPTTPLTPSAETATPPAAAQPTGQPTTSQPPTVAQPATPAARLVRANIAPPRRGPMRAAAAPPIGGGVKSELIRIGVLLGVVGVIMAVLKLATPLG